MDFRLYLSSSTTQGWWWWSQSHPSWQFRFSGAWLELSYLCQCYFIWMNNNRTDYVSIGRTDLVSTTAFRKAMILWGETQLFDCAIYERYTNIYLWYITIYRTEYKLSTLLTVLGEGRLNGIIWLCDIRTFVCDISLYIKQNTNEKLFSKTR